MTEKSLPIHLEDICAQAIVKAFDTYQEQFKAITRRAKVRFETRSWHRIKPDTDERLDLYTKVVDQIVSEVKQLLSNRVNEKTLWMRTKAVYSGLSQKKDSWELAETFFNSVTRRIFATVGVDPQIEFTDTCSRSQPIQIQQPPYRIYSAVQSTQALIETILNDYAFQAPYKDLEDDAHLAAEKVDSHLIAEGFGPGVERLELLTYVLYRGKGAYLVGRMFKASARFPLVLALLHTSEGIVVDAVLLNENDVSILFSYTRSYFHVDVQRPAEIVNFLKTIMPRKRVAELYISIGFNKHGKSELYCDLLQHLSRSDQKFEIAEGERGMVMEVFTMPDYELVFKVIKDHFAFPKNTTRDAVMAKYHLVFKHDRAGRLVDAQEFEHLKFSRNRFSEELLNSLLSIAARNLVVNDEHIVVKHAYAERRVIPLDIYLAQVGASEAQMAVKDLGNAIKELAATNIFPGDMLLKNFGVTRHGRIVFYDYDELCLLSACNFRKLPRARSYEEELSGEPWFAVGENDVFPEEFPKFIGLQGTLRDVFEKHHGDLFEVHFWQQLQSRIKAGAIIDIYPYEQRLRLSHS